jgi:hypothetical protein
MAESGVDNGFDHRRHERRIRWGWWFFAAIALFFLLSEHRAHLFGILPYLFLLACPLMHRFMHHGHSGHHGHGGGSGQGGQSREDEK